MRVSNLGLDGSTDSNGSLLQVFSLPVISDYEKVWKAALVDKLRADNQLASASFSLAKSPVNLMGMDTKAKTTNPVKLHRFSSSLFRISAAPSKRLTKSVPRTGT